MNKLLLLPLLQSYPSKTWILFKNALDGLRSNDPDSSNLIEIAKAEINLLRIIKQIYLCTCNDSKRENLVKEMNMSRDELKLSIDVYTGKKYTDPRLDVDGYLEPKKDEGKQFLYNVIYARNMCEKLVIFLSKYNNIDDLKISFEIESKKIFRDVYEKTIEEMRFCLKYYLPIQSAI